MSRRTRGETYRKLREFENEGNRSEHREKIEKNSVTDVKIDPKVVMDLSIFKTGIQRRNQNQVEEFIDEKELWFLNGIPSRDPFLVTQFLEEILCEFRSTHEEIDVTS